MARAMISVFPVTVAYATKTFILFLFLGFVFLLEGKEFFFGAFN